MWGVVQPIMMRQGRRRAKTSGRVNSTIQQTERGRQDLYKRRDKQGAGANNQGNTWKEVKENTRRTRQTFKVKWETRQTKDRGQETPTKTQETKRNKKACCIQPTHDTQSSFKVDREPLMCRVLDKESIIQLFKYHPFVSIQMLPYLFCFSISHL